MNLVTLSDCYIFLATTDYNDGLGSDIEIWIVVSRKLGTL